MNNKLTLKRRGKSKALLEEFLPTDSIVTVGNNPGATILLDESEIAPEQFLMVLENGEFVLMNRAEGTILNGSALSLGARVALNTGDRVEVGSYELFYGEPESKPDSPVVSGTVDAAESIRDAGTGTAAVREVEKIADEETIGDVVGGPAQSVDPVKDQDFSQLLYELREEDTFYFHIHDKEEAVQRIPFEIDEVWIGTRLGAVTVDRDESKIDEVFARVNKDWSGVVIYPRDDQRIIYNGSALTEPMRLSNDDQLILVDDFEDTELETTISFHEPVALMALNSILPGELPEPVSSETGRADGLVGNADVTAYSDPGFSVRDFAAPRLLGYFTVLEVLIMAVGTIVTAAIIFFVLEFV